MYKSRSIILINKVLKFQLRQLKQHGFHVVWLNQNLSTHTDYEQHQEFIDETITVNNFSDSQLSELAKNYSFPPDSLVIANEGDLLVAAKLASAWKLDQSEKLNLESAELASNKYKQRNALAKLSPDYVIKFKLIKNVTDLVQFASEIKSRFILKPLNLDSSRGVKMITPDSNLEDVYSSTIVELSRNQKSSDIELLAEEFIEGEQYSVDSYHTKSGKVLLTPICKQIIGFDKNYKDFRTLYSIYPSYLAPKLEESVQNQLNEILRYIELPSATVHTEFKVLQGKVKIIEFNPRIGGFRNALLSIAYDFNHYENTIRAIIGEESLNIKHKLKAYAAAFQIWADSKGNLKRILNIERILTAPELVYFRQKYNIGEVVGSPANGFGKVGYAILRSNNDLLPYLDELSEIIRVEVE